jgi:hypothetical protein
MEFKARIRIHCITFLFQQMPSMADISNLSLIGRFPQLLVQQIEGTNGMPYCGVQGSSFLLSFRYVRERGMVT